MDRSALSFSRVVLVGGEIQVDRLRPPLEQHLDVAAFGRALPGGPVAYGPFAEPRVPWPFYVR